MTTYHFIGIKGTGMSALAHILHDSGYTVQGSDIEKHFFTEDALREKNIKILPFDESNIRRRSDTLLQVMRLQMNMKKSLKLNRMDLPFYRYHEFLGEWLKKFTSIAVTGAHGKTSTTGLLAHILKANAPISYLIGDGTG